MEWSGCVPLKGLLDLLGTHAPVHSPMSTFLRVQRCFVRHMHTCQCMRGASIGKPVQSVVFYCPDARGSLGFVVAPFYI